jgi:hypothetical protein
MQSNTILKPYDGLNIPFTSEGYINATVTAAHFGKRPIDFLRLPETKEYVARLCDFLTMAESDLIVTHRGGNQRTNTRNSGNGGTWLHRKLAVPFARWCDVRFAIWCDYQIELILSGEMPQATIAGQPRLHFALRGALRAFDLAKDAWGKQIAANQIKVLCGHLSIDVPDFALIGKPIDQYQLEV